MIPVAEFFYIDFNGEKTFVTRNFIATDMPVDLQHLYHFRADAEHSCEALIQAISQHTRQPKDVSTFIQTVLFDSLVGNHDRHGRNLGFIVAANGYTLSPIYDNVSYLGLEKGEMLKADFNPSGKISTLNTYEPTMWDYVKELVRLGHRVDVNIFFRKIDMTDLFLLVDKSYCSELMKNAMKKLLSKRFEELKHELNNQAG